MKKDDKILDLFKKNRNSFLSGEEISRALGISRQALWKHIEKLREIGYIIEAVPHLGYKLLAVPDKILVPEIRWNLKTKFIGKEIYFYESVGSTNNVAYELAEEGAGEGTVVIANEQTKGKGRLGRKWVSPGGRGIYLSCVLRPDILPNEVPKITLVAAVSAAKAIRKFLHIEGLIRWPNDILISDRKAGGILTELKGELDRVNFVILGIGINVNTPKSALPKGSTSLKEESKSSKDFSRVELVKILLETLEKEYMKFKEDGFSTIRHELKSYSCALGRYVSITTSGKKRFHGKAIDINDNGGLVVKLDDGSRKTFLSGDVALIR
ncbi:MAG: biotin--[acetyl-CoA-carboxylase] ligase [Candidatus Omnitrophota bacterium]|nr:MAG: biotin--[acetyl-CoA-carboxylase] ligase [Candidatus Omnitrophota bacterium]